MANTINYLSPVVGATPPTQAQAAVVNTVIATIAPGQTNAPTQALTHNLQIPAADISSGWPNVGVEPLDNLAGTSAWFIQSIDPNYVGLAQANSSGGFDTSAQIKVKMSRPNTLIR
jgi:hypothetical protein